MSHNNYINGCWSKGNGIPIVSKNPATGDTVWEGYTASSKEIDTAVSHANEAQLLWSKLTIVERISFLKSFQEQLERNKESLAKTISTEVGKPYWESLTEVGAMIGKINISITAHNERCPSKEAALNGNIAHTRHKPHGTLAVFGPYNFPGHLPNGHIVPALLAGNSVIFKPSELTPLVAEETVRLWEKTGIPKGVIQLLQGDKDTAINLSEHKYIDGLLFTGSWKTGSLLTKKFASMPEKILALELGGNNPLIVFNISDISAAAYTIIMSSYITSGQRCTCARRLIISNGSDGDRLIDTLVSMIEKIKIGNFKETPEPFMGPLISEEAAGRIFQAQDFLKKNGGDEIVEAKKLPASEAYVTPGLIDVTSVSDRPDTEYFGPLLQVIRVESFEKAIAEANNTKYGLAAGLLSDNKNDYEEFFHRIRAGIVNWNTQTTGAISSAPFGGLGQSGNYRPSAYYAADYCSFPVASIESDQLRMPASVCKGLEELEACFQ